MTVPIWIEQQNGHFVATVIGAPNICASANTRDLAVEALRAEVAIRLSSGNLQFMDVEPGGLLELGRKHINDEDWNSYWDEISSDSYRVRDELKAKEFGEQREVTNV